ncbi:MAG TPA: VTT domain-containing protein [Methylomusa anaerophila]|uniref:TVP38/TMEM64 family membrane protein n=1 Tax=Methylomusa anaerophila TaxID=1930071 RepID=A0A348ALZ2_9FIRM|nr:VTT domain-containing protein [Methylomusa anaerophila]BBB92090.1 TVP38/TMEM64 family inner membrane protein YdjZ [Methylomusa anaerophila]HML87896.1 VTT domain-containing protein [Methylomusa anaerophila]
METKIRRQESRRVMVVLCLAAVVVIAYLMAPAFFKRLFSLLIVGDVLGSIEFIRSFGPYAMIVSFFIIVFINATGVLPNIFMLAVNGIIFGVALGTFISWLAESVGVILGFLLMRYIFRDYAQSLIVRSNALKSVDEFSCRSGFKIMLIARAVPYIPSGLITALGAISCIKLKDYALATFIGKIPSAYIEVTMGHDLFSYQEHIARLALLLLISGASYLAFLWYKKKRHSR